MNSKKTIPALGLILLLLLSNVGFSQDMPPGFNKIIPPSPTAAGLGKYGDIPVNLYTGIPNINIPLWEVKSRKLNLPVSLSYHASGIKVEENSGWVGLGWSLNAGGVITRTVRGKPDDKTDGYYTNPWFAFTELENEFDSYEQWEPPYFYGDPEHYYDEYLREIAQGNIDGEPDVFFFNFNGYTGKFVFDINGNPVVIPHQNIQVTVSEEEYNGQIKSWLVITEDGTKYYFGGNGNNEKTSNESTSYGPATDKTSFYSCWYMYKISTPDYNNEINLNYSDYYTSYYRSLMPHSREGCDDPDEEYYYVENKYETKYLTSIVSASDSIVFHCSSKEQYTWGDYICLDSIVIIDQNCNRFKKYEFEYSFFETGTCNESTYFLVPCKRVRLDRIFECSVSWPGHSLV